MAQNKVEVLLTARDQASGKINKNTQAMQGMTGASKTLGSSLTALKGIAVTAFAGWGVSQVGKNIIKIGADFKYTMAIVRGVSQATGKQYAALEAKAREMGATTEWSATQAAEGLQFLSMAGFKAEKAIAALPVVLDLATAGNIDLARSADLASNALTAMRLPVEDLDKVADVFIQTITSSNTNMEMMAESFKYAAPVAAGFGIKIERLAALIGLLGNAGVQGSMAGTQLSMAMLKSQKVFDKYGASAKNADGSTKDFVDALELLEKVGGDANEVLDAFTFRAGRAALALLGQGTPAIKAYIKEIENAEGANKRLADIIRDTTKIDWKILTSGMNAVAQEIFDIYETQIRKTLQGFTSWIREHKKEVLGLSSALGDLGYKLANIVIPALDKIWTIISYDPAIMEFGLIGLAVAGRKGAMIGAAIGHTIGWLELLSSALGLASVGAIKFSDIMTSNFKELEKLVNDFDVPTTMLEGFNAQVKELEKQIAYLKTATEGKAFTFSEDKEELALLENKLKDVQARIETLKLASKLDIDLSKPIDQAKRLASALKDPAAFFEKDKPKKKDDGVAKAARDAVIKALKIQEEFAFGMSAIEAKRIADRNKTEKETIENFRQAKMTETELAMYELDKQFLEYDTFVKDKEALDNLYVKEAAKITKSANKAALEARKEFEKEISEVGKTAAEIQLATIYKQAKDWENLGYDKIKITRWTEDEISKITDDTADAMTDAFAGWAKDFGSTLNEMFWGAETTFGSILKSFAKMITQMIIQKSIIEPMFSGGSSGKGLIGGLISGGLGLLGGGFTSTSPALTAAQAGIPNTTTLWKKGGAFLNGIADYSNQIVNTPTRFAFASGAGLMGEAGSEAIMPLTRTSDGDLGVKTQGGNDQATTIIINAIDSKSFAEVVKRNPQSIVTVIGDAMKDRTGLRNVMKGTM